MNLLRVWTLAGLVVLPGGSLAGEPLAGLRERFAGARETAEVPNFQRHVVPLLGRLGCNGRNCHGSFQGRGGFKLSMFGYDFAADHEALVSGKRPKVDLEAADDSLMLIKPTLEKGHGGGKRFDRNGWEYRTFRAWIAGGAKQDSQAAGKLLRLDVAPREMLFGRVGQEIRLRATAHWSDGTQEDVTPLVRFWSNDEGVAQVDADGVVKCVGKGSSYIISAYDRCVESNLAILPVSDLAGDRFPAVPAPTRVDETILANLRKLGIVPSDLCADEEFLRRVSLDITGTLPTPQEVSDFLADKAPDRRRRKVDELLERPAYWTWWTTKLCDLTGLNAPLQLGGTEFAKVSGEQWQAWMERRLRDNTGYDQIARGLILALSRKKGQSYGDFAAELSQYTRRKDPLDYSDREFMPHYWYRENLNMPEEKALSFAYTFLGVRLDCAQCHKHPFDQWSQQDFKQFVAFFPRVKRGIAPESEADHRKLQEELGNPIKKTAAVRRGFYLKLALDGKPAPWREVYIAPADLPVAKGKGKPPPPLKPRILGGAEINASADEHPLQPLMDWLLKQDNPYFARAFVNRVWAHYFGRGIVDPPDDLNLGNPPSNKELLKHLADGFVAHGYNMKWLHREICNSHAYQRSWATNETNKDDETHFSRANLRRLPAEVAVDALALATIGSKKRPAWLTKVKERRIAQQAAAFQSRTEFGLVVFGKPLRLTNCDCERQSAPSLLQAIYLRNDQDLHAMLDRPDGWLKEIDGKASAEILIREAYLRTLNRAPIAAELQRCREYLERAASLQAGMRDVLWALLNTKEFITNH
jgi:hypothetical protein